MRPPAGAYAAVCGSDDEEAAAASGEARLLQRSSSCRNADVCTFASGEAVDDPQKQQASRRLKVAICISFAFMLVEMVGGYYAGSLAIMTDGAHLLSDVGAFCVSLLTMTVALRPSEQTHSFGYHRLQILGALFSVVTIWLVTGMLVLEAVQRLMKPQPVQGRTMFVLACCGVGVNLVLFQVLAGAGGHGHSHGTHRPARLRPELRDDAERRVSTPGEARLLPAGGGRDRPSARALAACCASGGLSGGDHGHGHSHGHSHGGQRAARYGSTSQRARGHGHGHGGGAGGARANGSAEPSAHGGQTSSPTNGDGHSHSHGGEGHSHSHGGDGHGHSHGCDGHSHSHGVPARAASAGKGAGTSPAGPDGGGAVFFTSGGFGNARQPAPTSSSVEADAEARGDVAMRRMQAANGSRGCDSSSDDDSHDGHSHGEQHGHGHGHGHGHDGSSSSDDEEQHDESLRGHHGEDVNVRGAYLHVIGDLLQSIGVAIAGAVIWWKPQWSAVDPVCTFLFSLLVLGTTGVLLRDIVDVIMERTPRELDPAGIQSALLGLRGVAGVHDLHVWHLMPGKPVLTVHVVRAHDADSDAVRRLVQRHCERRLRIDHATIQVEEG